MLKLPVKEWVVLAGMALALAFCIHFLNATPALSATETSQSASLVQVEPVQVEPVQVEPGAIATAPEAPKLVPAVLGGKRVYVLYSTRANDVILVRCYPTYEPALQVKAMGGQPGVKEGTLTCKAGAAM